MIWQILLVAIAAFYAGYWTGRRRESEEINEQLDELLEKLREVA